jgi:hypothetical protein
MLVEPNSMEERATELLKENPLISLSGLTKRLRCEGFPASDSRFELIYRRHRRSLGKEE